MELIAFIRKFSLALYNKICHQEKKKFALLEKVEIIRKPKDYNGGKINFASLIEISYSILQTILKQADLKE